MTYLFTLVQLLALTSLHAGAQQDKQQEAGAREQEQEQQDEQEYADDQVFKVDFEPGEAKQHMPAFDYELWARERCRLLDQMRAELEQGKTKDGKEMAEKQLTELKTKIGIFEEFSKKTGVQEELGCKELLATAPDLELYHKSRKHYCHSLINLARARLHHKFHEIDSEKGQAHQKVFNDLEKEWTQPVALWTLELNMPSDTCKDLTNKNLYEKDQ